MHKDRHSIDVLYATNVTAESLENEYLTKRRGTLCSCVQVHYHQAHRQVSLMFSLKGNGFVSSAKLDESENTSFDVLFLFVQYDDSNAVLFFLSLFFFGKYPSSPLASSIIKDLSCVLETEPFFITDFRAGERRWCSFLPDAMLYRRSNTVS